MEKFDKDLEEIKTELNNIKLSEEFKTDLKVKMEEEFNKSNIKEKTKNLLFPRKLVATFACFFLVITSCVVFAEEIESFVTKIFSNTDRKIEIAIANGKCKKIDMEYVENDGVGIKVDYIIQEDDSICIAFNVKSEEEFDNIYLDEIEIRDDNQIFFKTQNGKEESKIKHYVYNKKNTSNEYNIIYKFILNEIELKDFYIQVNSITLFNNNNVNTINKTWKLEEIN